jgi:hypothetical protein
MKSLLVVPSSSTNFAILNDNYQNNKENIEIIETGVANNTSSKISTYHHTNSNSTYDFSNICNNLTDNNNINPNINTNNNTCTSAILDFQKLKRSHAIQDIQAMDDYSPVTYETSICTNADWILEEDKFVVQGIKVRAAKIPKLLLVLIESFG